MIFNTVFILLEVFSVIGICTDIFLNRSIIYASAMAIQIIITCLLITARSTFLKSFKINFISNSPLYNSVLLLQQMHRTISSEKTNQIIIISALALVLRLQPRAMQCNTSHQGLLTENCAKKRYPFYRATQKGTTRQRINEQPLYSKKRNQRFFSYEFSFYKYFYYFK